MTVKRFVASLVGLAILQISEVPVVVVGRSAETCLASHSKLDAAVHDRVHALSPGSRVQAIVSVRAGALDSVLSLLPILGGRVHALHSGLSAVSLEIGVGALATLIAIPSVLSIAIDAPLSEDRTGLPGGSLAERAADPGTAGSTTHLRETLGLDARWTGRGVGVAVIDSGLQPQSGFAGRIRAFRDFTGGDGTVRDDFGHGTHVAGLIGGTGLPDGSYQGVAPDVAFIVLKVLDGNGVGQTSDVISAIEFAIANKAPLGIDIINLSLGHPIYEPAATDPLVRAVEAATRAGILVVVSAGNYGTNAVTGLPGYAGVTRLRTRRRSSLSGPSRPSERRSAATIGLRVTAPADRRGMTLASK